MRLSTLPVQACWAHVKQGACSQALISIRGEKGRLLKPSLPSPFPPPPHPSQPCCLDYGLLPTQVCLALPFILLGTLEAPWVLTLLCSPVAPRQSCLLPLKPMKANQKKHSSPLPAPHPCFKGPVRREHFHPHRTFSREAAPCRPRRLRSLQVT